MGGREREERRGGREGERGDRKRETGRERVGGGADMGTIECFPQMRAVESQPTPHIIS